MLYLSGGPLISDQHRAARAYLDKLYRQAAGTPPPALEKSPSGKPCFASGSLFCSLSHTRQGAFCALSDAAVGLDAEPLDRVVTPALSRRVLSPGELVDFQENGSNRLLLTYWVLKESYLKFTGEGLSHDPRTLTFDLSGPYPRLVCPEGEKLHFTLLSRCGHLIALCSPLDEPPLWRD